MQDQNNLTEKLLTALEERVFLAVEKYQDKTIRYQEVADLNYLLSFCLDLFEKEPEQPGEPTKIESEEGNKIIDLLIIVDRMSKGKTELF